jgi:predicted permease
MLEGEAHVQMIMQDIRYGIRMLSRAPLVTVVVVATLALGIGATTGIFEFVEAGLVRGVPFRNAQRLVHISMTKQAEFGEMEASYPNYLDWQALNTSFDSLAGYTPNRGLLWAGAGDPEPVATAQVSANFFQTLEVTPELGRSFGGENVDSASQNQPMIISQASWKSRFGSRRDILGHQVRLGSNAYTIVGVLPAGFEFAPLGSAELFVLPPQNGPMITRRNLHWFQVIGLLKPGVTQARAFVEMTAISTHLAELYPQSNAGTGVHIVSLRDFIVGSVQPILLLLFAAGASVLILSCGNVANVLLAKSAVRRQELAIRLALGAGRGRLVRQMLTESVLLALLAGIASLIITRFGVAALLSTVPASVAQSMPFLQNAGTDAATVLFTAIIAVAAGVILGVASTLSIPMRNPQQPLSESGRNPVGGHHRVRSLLVVSEIAIAAALLMVSGLLLKTVSRIVNADAGFNRHKLLLLTYALPPESYKDSSAIKTFERELELRVAALPGVIGVAEISLPPLSDCNGCNTNRFAVEGKPLPEGAAQPEAASRGASRNYFSVLQARLLKGRTFAAQDYADNAAPVVVVNRALQDEYFNGDAVGKHLTFTFAPGQPVREIVGVVDNIKEGFLDATVLPALYTPLDGGTNGNLLVRTGVEPSSVAGVVRNTILGIDRNIALFGIMTMDTRVANSTTMFLRNLPATLMTSFGVIALLLAALGIYGVVSYSVAQRTREFGMRLALGASPGDLLRMVLGAALRLSVIGIGVGLLCAAIVSKAASGLFFDIRAADFASFAAVPFIVGGIAIVASFVPAQRAARLDPMEALRYE